MIFPVDVPSKGWLTVLSRRITLSTKIRVKLQRTCNPHAMVVVSVLFVFISIAIS